MPNKVNRDKKSRTRSGRNARPTAPALRSVKDLLVRRTPVFSESAAQQARQDEWRARLESIFPASLTGRISGIVERSGELTIYAESAAWATRLRYEIAAGEASLRAGRPEIATIAVRVLPRRTE